MKKNQIISYIIKHGPNLNHIDCREKKSKISELIVTYNFG